MEFQNQHASAFHAMFFIRFYGTTKSRGIQVPTHINQLLVQAETPEEIERIICEHETELAQLNNRCDEFLVSDSAAELMADVLRSKGIGYQVICGINDEGNSHSYVQVGNTNYDPTHQGFGADIDNEEEESDG